MARLILGHTTDTSIKIWVRGEDRWPVAFVDVLDSADRRTSSTRALELSSQEFWTGIVVWEGLSPDRPYRVKVGFGKSVEDTEYERVRDAYTEARFRTFPQKGAHEDFSFLLGSCNLHSLGFIKNPDKVWARISEVASSKSARFMIHCGDQIYADIPARPVSDPAHYRKKYLDAWDDCRTARAFLTQTAQYMILDDHEIINNFDLDMNLPDVDHVALRNAAMQAYWEFQHKHNPDTSSAGGRREYYYSFSYGLTEFFVMDTRFRRSSKLGQMIDPVQLESFKAWLLEHKSRLKFIVTIVPFIGQLKRAGDDKWCSPCFAEQRSNILEFLHKNRIGKTVFLTGDMHTSYHAKAKISDGVYDLQIHELMSSPINQFTPDTDLEETYEPVHRFVMSDHLAVTGKITPNSFFGDHSSVMAISIKSDRVGYQVFRTSKPGGAITSRSFVP